MKKTKLKIMLVTLLLSSVCSFTALAGWEQLESGSWRYYNDEDGSMATMEWVKSGDNWYFMDENGEIAVNTIIQEPDGKLYCTDSNGIMITNDWILSDENKYYYAGPDGAFLKSTTTPDGYTVDANGVWYEGTPNQELTDDEELAVKTLYSLLNHLKDPDSLKVYSVYCHTVTYDTKAFGEVVRRQAVIKYSATNSFGGRVTNRYSGYYDPEDYFTTETNFASITQAELNNAYDTVDIDKDKVLQKALEKFNY